MAFESPCPRPAIRPHLSLPPGFQRIRYFGFLANCHRTDKLVLCRQLLATPCSQWLPQPTACRNYHAALIAGNPRLCPVQCRHPDLHSDPVALPWSGSSAPGQFMTPPRRNSRPLWRCLPGRAPYTSAQSSPQPLNHPPTGPSLLRQPASSTPIRIIATRNTRGYTLTLRGKSSPAPLFQVPLRNKTH
jgi:hypothetical protein